MKNYDKNLEEMMINCEQCDIRREDNIKLHKRIDTLNALCGELCDAIEDVSKQYTRAGIVVHNQYGELLTRAKGASSEEED